MIACTFHKGSGLGNQLARYVAVRALAKDKGYEFGVINPENFKGASFIDLDMGVPVKDLKYEFNEKKIVENGVDIRSYDPDINFVKDFTLIDGEFQDPRYFEHRLEDIREWFKYKTGFRYLDMFTCVINFRGGEYVGVPDLFLPKEYWDLAIKKMLEIEPKMKFVVHTDDVETAKKFFPDFECISDIEQNFKAIKTATYLILSNSSFGILPAHLNNIYQEIIAPRYWSRYNTKTWALPQNFYKDFTYIHHDDNSQ